MKNQTKTFTKNTELVFSTITIIQGKLICVATFDYGETKDNMTDKVIVDLSLKRLLEKVSKFLDCEINERHYIIK